MALETRSGRTTKKGGGGIRRGPGGRCHPVVSGRGVEGQVCPGTGCRECWRQQELHRVALIALGRLQIDRWMWFSRSPCDSDEQFAEEVSVKTLLE